MAKAEFYIQAGNTELGGYDIYRRGGKILPTGELEDVKVATIYDPDHIDLFLKAFDMQDEILETDFPEFDDAGDPIVDNALG